MKGFKKLALVAAISAAPFAQAELTAMDDSLLSEMTGQAGVSIELDTAVTIGSITWTDDDGADVSATEGSLVLSNIAFGGANVGGSAHADHDARFDDIKIDIDVDGNDGLVIHLGGTDNLGALTGTAPVDFGLSIESVRTGSLVQDIASDIKIAGNLGPIDIIIDGDGALAANDLINVEAYFEVTSGSLDVDVIGLGIDNLKIGQNSAPILGTGSKYQADIKTGLVIGDNAVGGTLTLAQLQGSLDTATAAQQGAAVTAAGDAAEATIYQAAYDADILAGGDDASATIEGNNAVTADAGAARGVAETATSGNTALMAAIQDATENGALASSLPDSVNGVENMAFVSLSVGTAATGYFDIDTASTVVVANALEVNLTDFNIDVSMDILLGGTSIGNVAIDDLNMSGTNLKIYGH